MKTRTGKGFANHIAEVMKKKPQGLRAFKRRHDEPLTPSQAARLSSLVKSLNQPAKPKLNTKPTERRMVRGDMFSLKFADQLREAAYSLGVDVATLNEDQKKLLVQMAQRAMGDAERLRMLADAAD